MAAQQPRPHWLEQTLLGLALMILVVTSGFAQSVDETREYQVKALFLYNFANFVEWPEDAFESPASPLRMCLYGEVPFSGFLEPFDSTRIRERELTIIQTDNPDRIHNGCHILFVGANKLDEVERLFSNLNHLFVLSVGSMQGFTDKGGIVNILRTRDQQKFEINLSKAIENGLLIDSDLLALARVINE